MEVKAAMRSMDKDYVKSFEECLQYMRNLAKKSPEHGNALMDILGMDRYRLLLSYHSGQDCSQSIIDFISMDN